MTAYRLNNQIKRIRLARVQILLAEGVEWEKEMKDLAGEASNRLLYLEQKLREFREDVRCKQPATCSSQS